MDGGIHEWDATAALQLEPHVAGKVLKLGTLSNLFQISIYHLLSTSP